MNYFKSVFGAFCIVIGLGFSTLSVFADGLKIKDPRARPSLGVAKNSVTFFTIHNMTGTADKLLSVHSDVAKKVELHTHLKENGIFKMRPVEFIEIPANGKVELKSGGLHVMIIGVHSKLKIGDSFKLKLNFEQAKPMTITIPVLKIGARKKHIKKHGEKHLDGMMKKKATN